MNRPALVRFVIRASLVRYRPAGANGVRWPVGVGWTGGPSRRLVRNEFGPADPETRILRRLGETYMKAISFFCVVFVSMLSAFLVATGEVTRWFSGGGRPPTPSRHAWMVIRKLEGSLPSTEPMARVLPNGWKAKP